MHYLCMIRESVLLLLFAFFLIGPAEAQSTFCTTSASPPVLRSEGLAERVGDVALSCVGAPNAQFTANFTFILSLPVTNRLSATNTLTGIVFTIDSGSGPLPTLVQPVLANQFSVAFDGVTVAFSPQGTAKINVAGVRVNASQVLPQTPITEYVSINAASFPLTTPQLVVGTTERGLFASNIDALVCAQNGSPLPADITFSNLLAANTSFASTRVTEGFGDAFGPQSAPDYFMADSGQRIIVTYGGFPSDAQLFVPDRVAGSDATTPTAGGDFELPASGGSYTPSPSGSLLLARVVGAASNGAGGTPIYSAGAIGSGTVTFDTVSQIPITNGTAYVVYEVVDANPSAIETVQFPTFLGLAPDGSRTPSTTTSSVLFAPQSKVAAVSPTEPLPRFDAITPLPDCTILGDCSFVQSSLNVDTTPLQFTESQGGVTGQLYFTVGNKGHGFMNWTASISYPGTPGWLTLDPASGVNASTVRAYASPGNLAPATYQATININAGAAGSAAIQVTFTVTPPAPKPTPTITSALNSASMLPGAGGARIADHHQRHFAQRQQRDRDFQRPARDDSDEHQHADRTGRPPRDIRRNRAVDRDRGWIRQPTLHSSGRELRTSHLPRGLAQSGWLRQFRHQRRRAQLHGIFDRHGTLGRRNHQRSDRHAQLKLAQLCRPRRGLARRATGELHGAIESSLRHSKPLRLRIVRRRDEHL